MSPLAVHVVHVVLRDCMQVSHLTATCVHISCKFDVCLLLCAAALLSVGSLNIRLDVLLEMRKFEVFSLKDQLRGTR